MSAALKQCKVNDKFQDPLFLFLELIRGGVLHGKLWSQRAYSGGPSFGEGESALALATVADKARILCRRGEAQHAAYHESAKHRTSAIQGWDQ